MGEDDFDYDLGIDPDANDRYWPTDEDVAVDPDFDYDLGKDPNADDRDWPTHEDVLKDITESESKFSGPEWSKILKALGLTPTTAAILGGTGLASLFGGSGGFGGSSGDTGYKGGIPSLAASRTMLPIPHTVTTAAGGEAYLRANPDVAAAYLANSQGLSPTEYAAAHYAKYGQGEGRTLATAPRRAGSGGVTYFSPMRYKSVASNPGLTPTPFTPPTIIPAGGTTPTTTPSPSLPTGTTINSTRPLTALEAMRARMPSSPVAPYITPPNTLGGTGVGMGQNAIAERDSYQSGGAAYQAELAAREQQAQALAAMRANMSSPSAGGTTPTSSLPTGTTINSTRPLTALEALRARMPASPVASYIAPPNTLGGTGVGMGQGAMSERDSYQSGGAAYQAELAAREQQAQALAAMRANMLSSPVEDTTPSPSLPMGTTINSTRPLTALEAMRGTIPSSPVAPYITPPNTLGGTGVGMGQGAMSERDSYQSGGAAYQAELAAREQQAQALAAMRANMPSYARGGIASLAKGRLLNGPGDGVSDSIPASIDGRQPAALADGEYVIPARIVSELGNGSTKAGAQQLDAMMKRIQNTRRKATDIAANTRATKHLPA